MTPQTHHTLPARQTTTTNCPQFLRLFGHDLECSLQKGHYDPATGQPTRHAGVLQKNAFASRPGTQGPAPAVVTVTWADPLGVELAPIFEVEMGPVIEVLAPGAGVDGVPW